MSAQYAGVIFDLDGTLVDSRLDFDTMRSETGCPDGMGLLEFQESQNSPQARARTADIIHRHEMAGAAAATWMPGAREALDSLVARALPLGIVTRNSRQAATLTLQRLEAPPIDLVSREDALPKPDPDGLLQLARRWNAQPNELIYIGDFRFDLEAASNAGMWSALYLQADNRGYAQLADYAFERFEQLLEWLRHPRAK